MRRLRTEQFGLDRERALFVPASRTSQTHLPEYQNTARQLTRWGFL